MASTGSLNTAEAAHEVDTGAEATAAAGDSPQDSRAQDGDFVILWGGYAQVFSATLKTGAITNNRFGNFHHDDIIGRPFGSKVRAKSGGAWLALLRPSPELITQSLVHRTQINYHADISMLLVLLDAQPGRIFVEAGTGSGSVSTSLARALQPGGRLHTFEFHADRQQQAAADFVRYGLQDVVVSRHRDVCQDGFGEDLLGRVDGAFLDMPMPWLAIPHLDASLVEGGKVCCFSPCIEQVGKTAAELRREDRYQDLRMFETLAVNWGVRAEVQPKRRQGGAGRGRSGASNRGRAAAAAAPAEEAGGSDWVSYQMPMRSHTGYLLVATKALSDEPKAKVARAAAVSDVSGAASGS